MAIDHAIDETKVLGAEVPKSLNDQIEFWKVMGVKSGETRAAFNQHLAVLSAGSIAVIASGAVALMSYRSTHPGAGGKLLIGTLLTASVALWLALACCIIHNFLGTVILDQNFDTSMKSIVTGLAKLAVTARGQDIKADPWRTVISKQTEVIEARAKREMRLASMQRWISALAVVLFLLGYAALIYLIWEEARLL